MGVKATHPDYDKFCGIYRLVRNVLDNNAKEQIKFIDEADTKRMERYRDDAILTNFTLRTLDGYIGMVNRRPADVELPVTMEYILEDATPNGWTLEQLDNHITREIAAVGRIGLLSEFPDKEDSTTAAEVDEHNIHSRICPYSAESIINWAVERVYGRQMLTMVVLKECTAELQSDGFTWANKDYYRVLRLVDNVYVQELYDDAEALISTYTPKMGDGSTWNYIPFVFAGSKNNDTDPDRPPLETMARLNIGHYRNSADLEEMSRLIGQPTLAFSCDMSHEELQEVQKGKPLLVGSRQAMFLGRQGDAKYIQPQESQIADVLMKRKEEQAIMLGAMLITPINGNETVDGTAKRASTQVSSLTKIVQNVSQAIETALEHCAIFENIPVVDGDIKYTLNEKFFDDGIDPAAIMSAVQLSDRRVISQQSLYEAAQRAGVANVDRTFEEEQELIDAEPIMDMIGAFAPPPDKTNLPDDEKTDDKDNGQYNDQKKPFGSK